MPTRNSSVWKFFLLSFGALVAENAPDVSIFDDDVDDSLSTAAGNEYQQSIFESPEKLASLDGLSQTATAATTISDASSEFLASSSFSDPSEADDWFVDSSNSNLDDFLDNLSDDLRIADVDLSSLPPKCESGLSNRKLRSRTDFCNAGNPNNDLDVLFHISMPVPLQFIPKIKINGVRQLQ